MATTPEGPHCGTCLCVDALTACVDIIGRLEQYEETHPPVVDGAPCLHAALTAAKAAISAPTAGGDRG